ncbi:TniB family NTP-binding protein [Aliarcobacter butzleri]|uniref:TniB family NTP-binding protein n=1 Tax=Aliarcobacter butzleri TaxID=28197 RepID=UPI001EDA1B01|nr:TniB family NTP-binding protein [Aliarcobacter butzleri]MCG3655871.1 TniB family NTP-binding protein [Aliarcobacter butzleri]
MNDFEYLNEQTKQIIYSSKEYRLSYIDEPLYIEYPRTKELFEIFEQMIKTPKKPRMPNLLVIGEPNIGKTSIINQFYNKHNTTELEDVNGYSIPNRPVILATAHTKANEKDLYIAILEAFWTPHKPNNTLAQLRHQMFSLMIECKVKLLIIDEIHHFLNGTPSQQRDIMQALKNIGTKLQIPIIGVGIKDASLVLGTDPQLSSRFDMVKLSAWELDKSFRGLVNAFEKYLPLQKPSKLAEQEKCTLLHNISQGNLGDLHKLLIACAKYAIENNIEEITIDIIRKFKNFKPTSKLVPREIQLKS